MRRLALATLFLFLFAAGAQAQRQLTAPLASPYAKVMQTVGLTDLAVEYHRPAVSGRQVWGDLVPYGEVWRAGANENTVFETSTDVMIEGEPLPAGRYGLHMIPNDGEWTVIFSTVDGAWGSYSYDPSEDALRVGVTPREADAQERLAYRFDNPDENSATLVLHWAGREVPVLVEADTRGVVLASMERELRGVAGFFPEGWDQIATYALDSGRRLDDALAWADRSIELRPQFSNRMTRAALLDALDRSDEAEAARDEAYAEASDDEVRTYARARRRAGDDTAADAALGRLGGRP